ncbi:glycosyltransferase [Gemmatimonas aurantiaca T-27]|uniref:Glycosyltransferase n=1 Tax=Gemmatimonas aurantiaca (strain DSM 14586 / JCM 11422 / NBRC 100505 / T-27) TaxID=379066 RepID=C1A8U7_GEMAT|nr:glycosyltransferase [Gemmatimonas aurantiaca]BAH38657.1 glycosyltransferase [Gemmatimonas aurantiaca T-27]
MSGSPRVLFVTHNAPRYVGDAAGSFVLRLAHALQQQGAQVDILAPGAAGLAPHEQLEGVSITRVRYADDQDMTLAYEGNMAELVRASWRGKRSLVQLMLAMRRTTARTLDAARRAGMPYDIVHAHWWFPAALSLWHLRARTAVGTPLVITMHGSDVRLAERTAPAHPLMRAVLGEAAIRTAVSSWLADTAQRIAPAAPVLVSPMPVDMRLFREKPVPPPPREGVLFVGRLNAQKGIADLLDAMARPALAGVPLHVVGDGPDRAALEARARAAGLEHRITWHRVLSQSELVPLYRAARVVAMPSRAEGLGLVAVEAQLCGTPVVAYADGGLPDVVHPDRGGTLVTVGDIDALARAIALTLENAERAEQLGAIAREDMLARFSPEAAAQRYLRHYQDARGHDTHREHDS